MLRLRVHEAGAVSGWGWLQFKSCAGGHSLKISSCMHGPGGEWRCLTGGPLPQTHGPRTRAETPFRTALAYCLTCVCSLAIHADLRGCDLDRAAVAQSCGLLPTTVSCRGWVLAAARAATP